MCTSPLPARRVGNALEFLGRSESERFFFDGARLGTILQIPCGQCAECRLKRSREWAVRCMHEASMHNDNCFLTLTYDDEHVGPSLNYTHFQLFMKRLRAAWPNDKILFFCAGEYGETNPVTHVKDGGIYRPHFHCILFGFNFPDRTPCRMLGRSDLFNSVQLNKLWRMGDCKIGSVTFESAAYVARYAMKKVTGDKAAAHYTYVDCDGVMTERTPELLVMSKRPAIGRAWFERFGHHAYAHDSVVSRGMEMQPPRYYDKLLPDVVRGMVQRQREVKYSANEADHTDARNRDRDIVVKSRLSTFSRE